MSAIVLYGIHGSPFMSSVQIALEEKGVEYRIHPLRPDEFKGEEHLKRHPFGRVPVFEHEGLSLYETQAILRYVDQVFAEPRLTPDDPVAAARMNQIIGVIDCYFFPKAAAPIGFQRVIGPALLGMAPDETIIAEALPTARICIAEFDRLLGNKPFLTGDQLSIADIMLAAQLDLFVVGPEGQELLRDTGLMDWLSRMRERASMQATRPPEIFLKAA